jgi:hypothetical protein
MMKLMNAEYAKMLTDIRQRKYLKKRARRLKSDLNTVHWNIRSRARHGYYHARWDYRDSMDREEVKNRLIAEGYRIDESVYPYYEIIWEDEKTFVRKK